VGILKSRKLAEFIYEIQFVNRNPKDNSVLDLLDDISTNPDRVIMKDAWLYRSRIIRNQKRINQAPRFYGYGLEGSFIPPRELTSDMRANYRYIPYLYCADDPYLSMIEVRPRYGAQVSVATIRVVDELRLLDFTMRDKPKKMTDVKRNLFSDLSDLFSKPVTEEDSVLDYIPTQYIAEYTKNLGYDGIAYQSSLDGEMSKNRQGSQKVNVVIFQYEKCVPICSNVYCITNSCIECEQIDEDNERKDIICPNFPQNLNT
jgi:hypothetical protein